MFTSFLNNVNMCGIISEISMSMKKFNQIKTSVMKQILSIIAVAAVVTVGVVVFTNKTKTEKVDATELAQFKAWQDANEKAALAELNKPAVAVKPVAKRTTSYTSPRSVSTSQNAAKTSSTTTEKKGWSKAAKATAIGAAGGAVLGAVINKKNRAVGAVVGGVIGGGGGYVIGRGMDRKDGRVQPKS